MSVDPVALDRLIAELEWTVHDTRRPALSCGQQLSAGSSPARTVYVIEGGLSLQDSGNGAGRLPRQVDLRPGHFVLLTDQGAVRMRATERSRLVVSDLAPSARARSVSEALPAWLEVSSLDVREPAIAAVVAGMGADCLAPATSGGQGAVCGHLATAVVAVAMRTWAVLGCAPDDWLLRAKDPHIARAVEAMHAEPGRSWSVAELATVAAMSRSSFALRFRTVLQTSPADYLTRLRMAEAQRFLATEMTITEASRRLGYGSDEGFSRAFTRHLGVSPSSWRRQQLTLTE